MHGVLALPDTIYFPTSAGIEMCINEYMKQVLIECAPSCTDLSLDCRSYSMFCVQMQIRDNYASLQSLVRLFVVVNCFVPWVQIAAELNGEELAVIVPASMPAEQVEGPLPRPENVAVAKAGPGHLYLCGHACILGALHATKVSTQKLLDSDTAPVASVWTEEFKSYSQAHGLRCISALHSPLCVLCVATELIMFLLFFQSAAASMTPVGGYVLRECMKSTEDCNEEVPLGMDGDDQTP